MRLTIEGDEQVRTYIVSCAVLNEDNTWDTKDLEVRATSETTAKREGLRQAEKLSRIGCACLLGHWVKS